MPYLLFLKKHRNLKLSSAANCRLNIMSRCIHFHENRALLTNFKSGGFVLQFNMEEDNMNILRLFDHLLKYILNEQPLCR